MTTFVRRISLYLFVLFAFYSGYAQENSQINNSWLDKIDCSVFEQLGEWYTDKDRLYLAINLPEYLRAPEKYKSFKVDKGVGLELIFSEDDLLDKELGVTQIKIEVILRNEFSNEISYEIEVTFLNESIEITRRYSTTDKQMFNLSSQINIKKPPQFSVKGDDEKLIYIDFYY